MSKPVHSKNFTLPRDPATSLIPQPKRALHIQSSLIGSPNAFSSSTLSTSVSSATNASSNSHKTPLPSSIQNSCQLGTTGDPRRQQFISNKETNVPENLITNIKANKFFINQCKQSIQRLELNIKRLKKKMQQMRKLFWDLTYAFYNEGRHEELGEKSDN
ncbi:MAG: hypothetical protein AAGI90_06490, partial [Chlamydiota bacterium]